MKAKSYTFRVLLDSEGEAFRDIEISSDSSFKDLHLAIVDAVKFDGNELASFYICDNNWKRSTEIALTEMNDMSIVDDEEEEELDEDVFNDEEDEDENPKNKKAKKNGQLHKVVDEDDEPKKSKKSVKEKILVMHEKKLGDHIEKTTQKLIYIYDYYALWTFYIELSKIGELEAKVKYPRCTKKVGKLPEKSINDTMMDDEISDPELEEFAASTKKKSTKSKGMEEDLIGGFDDDLDDDDDIDGEFEDGYDDDDIDRFSKYN